MSTEGINYTLDVDSELRFEIEKKDTKVTVTLVSGLAELFGTELVKKKSYEFTTGTKVAIFTYHGCVLNLIGDPDVNYISKETPMVQYLNCHVALEQMRISAAKENEIGPVVMVVGPKDVGKSTLCRILLNYAVRKGHRPMYVDIDIGQGVLSIPGSVGATLVQRPIEIEERIFQKAPLIFHFGHITPSANNVLYNAIMKKMSEKILNAVRENKKFNSSGIIINTCGWVKGGGYRQLLNVALSFNANVIFVLDQERLYNELLRDCPRNIQVVLLPKSGGVVDRSKELRSESREQRIKEYFYGNKIPFYPFSFEVNFKDLKLYKIGAPSLPDSCLPIGMKAEDSKTKLVAVTPNQNLLHHILALSFAQTIDDDVIGTNIAGFVCVTDIDMEKQTITILSPQPRPLPSGILLYSEVQFMDSHA